MDAMRKHMLLQTVRSPEGKALAKAAISERMREPKLDLDVMNEGEGWARTHPRGSGTDGR